MTLDAQLRQDITKVAFYLDEAAYALRQAQAALTKLRMLADDIERLTEAAPPA